MHLTIKVTFLPELNKTFIGFKLLTAAMHRFKKKQKQKNLIVMLNFYSA